MKEHFSSRVTKLLVILALAIVASVMFVIVGCDGGTEEPPKHTTHTWVADTSREDVAASCTTAGVHYIICSECGMTSTEETPALGHEWANDGNMLRQEPTCTEDGYYYRECTREGCSYRETSTIIPKTGHKLNFADVTITPATCTTDGSLSGVCPACSETITLTADEIRLGENVTGFTFALAREKEKAAQEASETYVTFNIKGNEDAGYTILQAEGHTWNATADEDKDGEIDAVCVKDDAATTYANGTLKKSGEYAGYCTKCDALVAKADHDKPAGAANCIAAIDNENMSQADINAVAPENRTTHAYHCDVCDEDILKGDHNNQISTLVSGNPVLDPENAVFEPAEGVTKLDCHYYYVCLDCGEVTVSTPHTLPLTTDTANYKNCGHGDLCTVCGIEMTQPTGHKLDGELKDADDETFGTFTYAPRTCEEAEHAYNYCVYCKAREDAGEDVKWELNKNYKLIGADAYNHDDWQEGSYEDKTVALDGSTLTNCVNGYAKQDICGRCGEPRVSVKPTFYSKKTDGDKVTYTEIKKEADFNSAKDGDGVYTLANDKYTAIDFTKEDSELISWTTDRYGRPWTDANGIYGEKKDEHAFATVPMKDYPTEDLFEFNKDNKPFCNTVDNGVEVLKHCANCGMYTWETVSFDTFLKEVMGDMSLADYIATRDDWHAGKDMLVCPHGNSQCDACQIGNHNAQYYINFVGVDDPAIAIPQQIYYACVGDNNVMSGDVVVEKGNREFFAETMKNFVAQYAGIYNFTFYSDADCQKPLEADFTAYDDSWDVILHDNNTNGTTCNDDQTVYFKVTMVDEEDDNNYFTSYSMTDGVNDGLSWSDYDAPENTRDSLKGISFEFSESFIGHENISRIAISVTRTEGEGEEKETITMGTAISTGEQLTKLLASLTYPEANAENQMVEVNVGSFGYNEANGATPDDFWTMSNTNFRKADNTLYTGAVTVTISLTTSTGFYQAVVNTNIA